MNAAAASPGLRVDCLPAGAAWEHLVPAWRALCDAAGLSPFMTPEWWSAHMAAFENPSTACLLLAHRGPSLVGVLPLVSERAWLRGVPVRRLRAAAHYHTLCFDLVCEPVLTAAVAAAMWQWLRQQRQHDGWDFIELRDVPAASRAESLLTAAADDGCFVGRWQSPIETRAVPQVLTAGSGAADLPQTSRKFRAELRRTRRRLEKDLGPVRLESLTEPEPRALQEFFSLEAAGWKGGEGGNAVLRKPPAVRRYYEMLAGGAAAQSRFRLHRLWAGPHLLAMSFSLLAPDALIPLRWCYDERHARYGPGHLLIESLLQECSVQGRSRFAFMGEAFEYESKWAPGGLPHAFLFIFPPTRWGRWLRYLKFGLASPPRAMAGRPAALRVRYRCADDVPWGR